MPSNMQKNAKELIIYSALVAEFERLDFKEDALAGVRANYFNGKCAPQTEKTEIIMGGKTHSLSCSMQHGMPLSWKISCENLPVQTVRRASDGSYSVMSYGANGVIFKRQYFDANHLWLRTEYFDRALENRIAAVLYPKQTDGLTVLRLQRFMPSGIESRDLFPSFQAPKKRCAALVYSDSGMVWFDERFKTANKQAAQPSGRQEPQQGFRFAKEAATCCTSARRRISPTATCRSVKKRLHPRSHPSPHLHLNPHLFPSPNPEPIRFMTGSKAF